MYTCFQYMPRLTSRQTQDLGGCNGLAILACRSILSMIRSGLPDNENLRGLHPRVAEFARIGYS